LREACHNWICSSAQPGKPLLQAVAWGAAESWLIIERHGFQELIGLKRPKKRRSSEIANVSLFRRLESPFQDRKDRGSLGDLVVDQSVPRREVYEPVSPTLITFLQFIHHSF